MSSYVPYFSSSFFFALSLSSASLSITFSFHHVPSLHVNGGCSWIYGFLHGGALFQRETKNDFTTCCVEYELVEEQGESSKHLTTVLFWSILNHRGSGPPEIDHKVILLISDMWAKYQQSCFLSWHSFCVRQYCYWLILFDFVLTVNKYK